MDEIDALKARKADILASLATLKNSPSYNIDGQSESVAENRKALLDELLSLNKLIQQASGPFLIRSRGRAV